MMPKVPGGIVVGAQRRGNRFYTWLDVGDTHVLLIGGTRSGKSRRVIMPSIWILAHAGESMVLTDIKGELNAHCAAFLRMMGYKVVVLDFREPAGGNRWNLLYPVLAAIKKGDYSRASRAAQAIAHIMTCKDMPPGLYRGDPIWPNSQKSLTTALAMATAMEAPEKARHMGSAYRMLIALGSGGGEMLDEYFNRLPPDHQARIDYGVAAMAEGRLKSGIFTGAAAQLALWTDPGVCWMTSEQDHDLAGPGKEKTAVFLVIPDEDSAFHALAAIYITQAYQALAELSNQYGGTLPLKVNYLLDEAGNLPQIPDFDTKITTAAGRNMKFLLAVQGLDQLKKHYGLQANTISGNCATWIYLSTADPDTQKLLSLKTGKYTVRTDSYSSQRSRSSDYSHGVSDSLTGRPLLTPDEIGRWPKGRSLLLKTGQFPAQLPLPDLSEWPAADDLVKDTGKLSEEVVFDTPQFWVPEFTSPSKKKSSVGRFEKRSSERDPVGDAIDRV
jgi:type IV secretion system protein VirD4